MTSRFGMLMAGQLAAAGFRAFSTGRQDVEEPMLTFKFKAFDPARRHMIDKNDVALFNRHSL